MSETKFVHVYTAEGHLAGEMVKLLLESFNIQAVLVQESAGATYGLTVGTLGESIILVPEEQAGDAIEILRSMEEGKLEQPDKNADDEESNKDFTKAEE